MTDPDTWDGVRGVLTKNFAEPAVGLLQKGLEKLTGRVASKTAQVVVDDLRRLAVNGGERMAFQGMVETTQSLADLYKSLRGTESDATAPASQGK